MTGSIVALALAWIYPVPRILLMLPLCLSIAIVYKTLRLQDLRAMPRSTAILWVTIVLGMYGVGVGLWALFLVLA
jgi:hypothetical protein